MIKAYSSNLTQDQWELLKPLIPAAKAGGRPREVEIWEVLNAIFSLVHEGCRWRSLPGDFTQTGRSTLLSVTGGLMAPGYTFKGDLREWVRVDNERERSPSEVIVHSECENRRQADFSSGL